jgi:integrase
LGGVAIHTQEPATVSSDILKSSGADWIGVYNDLNNAIKIRQYSPATLKTYIGWTRKFQSYPRSKDSRLLTVDDVIISLMYGSGLRISECLSLRVHHFNFDMKILTIHDGKGKKDRTVPIPDALMGVLKAQLNRVIEQHERDCLAGYNGVFLATSNPDTMMDLT